MKHVIPAVNSLECRAWIFIIEGLMTVVAGAASFFIVQDFPDTAKFLKEDERAFVIRRLQEDDQFSAGGEELKWKYIWQSLLDWKTWVGSALVLIWSEYSLTCYSLVILYMGADGPLYAFSLFLPSIINQLGTQSIMKARQICDRYVLYLGFTATPANLLTVPVYVLACICTCFVGFFADRYGNRGYFTL